MSVKWRKDRKKFQVDVVVNGKRIRRLIEDRDIAIKWEATQRLNASGGAKYVEPSTLVECFQKYHADVSSRKAKDTSVNERRYFRIAQQYFAEIGKDLVTQVTQEDMDSLQKWLQVDHVFEWQTDNGIEREQFKALKASTVNRWFNTYRAFFSTMKKWERIDKSPCRYHEQLAEDEVTRELWTSEAVLKVFRASPAWFRLVVRCEYALGLPPAAMERLTWENVDLNRGLLTFERIKGRKARKRLTTLKLSSQLVREFSKLRRKFPLVGQALPVFRDERGARLTADRISKEASRVIKSCGYTLDFYAMKHTLAEDLRLAGVSLDQVSEVFGHADTRSTRRYSNKLPVEHTAANLAKVRGRGFLADKQRQTWHQDGTKRVASATSKSAELLTSLRD